MTITYDQAMKYFTPEEREMIRLADELVKKLKSHSARVRFSQDNALEVLFSIGKVYADEAKKQAARRAK